MSATEDLQLSLFSSDRLARRPYCADDLEYGLRIRSQSHALKHSHIQANSPALKWRLVFDIDRPAAVFAAEDANVATPNWIAENPRTGHVHACYEIETAIVTSTAGRAGPLRFAAAVEHAYMTALKADQGYVGLEPYNLVELSEWVDLPARLSKKAASESPLGRNVSVFDSLRGWAYRNIRKYSALAEWQFACRMQAASFNCFTTALPAGEVDHIAKSVAKWVWGQFDVAASDARFSALQSHRGAIGGASSGKVRSVKTGERSLEVAAMAALGMTQKAIAIALDVSIDTVKRAVKQSKHCMNEQVHEAIIR
jgi:hypothetical protein